MVIRDGGLRGLVLNLGAGCDAVRVEGDSVFAEAGAANGKAARMAREANLTGLEFFGGIPGSIGGALRMNAGAYGAETFNLLEKIWLLDDKGIEHVEAPDFVKPRYRHTELPAGWIYKAGQWKLAPGDREAIRQKMREINHARSSTQPLHMPSSGSWFKNPIINGEKTNAWKVVEQAGCRGMTHGGAQVSEQHANFFVNTGGATAKDLDALSKKVEAQVKEKLGIVLEREVRMIGEEK
jgi:UDP-N-acetylmuramate dehydrogenase